MKKTIDEIVSLSTVMFKVFIAGMVMMYMFETFRFGWLVKIPIILLGVIWTLGHQNINIIWKVFKE